MAYKSSDIITSIEKNYPTVNSLEIKNAADLDIDTGIKTMFQYLLGVTPRERYTNDISNYEHQMHQKLHNVGSFKCLSWSFDSYEIDELRIALREVADYFHINVDIDRIFEKAGVKARNDEHYYLVVTVVIYNIIYVE